MSTGKMHQKPVKLGYVVLEICKWIDRRTDRQRDTLTTITRQIGSSTH